MNNENSQCADDQNCQSNNKKAHQCSSICPSFEYLINEKITTNVSCIVTNCGETFSNLSVLNFHLKKVHRIDQTVSFNSSAVQIFPFNKTFINLYRIKQMSFF